MKSPDDGRSVPLLDRVSRVQSIVFLFWSKSRPDCARHLPTSQKSKFQFALKTSFLDVSFDSEQDGAPSKNLKRSQKKVMDKKILVALSAMVQVL